MNGTRRVIVGVSGSLRNMAAVHTAAGLAADLGQPLIAVNAWQQPGGAATARRAPCAMLDAACRARAREILTDALSVIAHDLDVDASVVLGPTGPVLVAMANRDTDLLVVGGGRTGVGRLFHTGTSRYCVRHAHGSVLTVPEPELVRAARRTRRHLDVAAVEGDAHPTAER
jgi:nucleotide-binding universal stress UspA family protein